MYRENLIVKRCTPLNLKCTPIPKIGVVLHPPCPTTERLRMRDVICYDLPHFAKKM